MQTPEQIIIEELKRIVEMQAKQISLLIAENARLNNDWINLRPENTATIVRSHHLKMKTGQSAPTACVRKVTRRLVVNRGAREKLLR